MGQKSISNKKPAWLPILLDVLLCFALALLGWYIYFTAGAEAQDAANRAAVYKYIMIAAGLGMVALLWFGELGRLRNLPSLLLTGYAAFSAISVFWAVAGRLFIQRYSVVFTALFFFLYAILRGRGDPIFARRAMSICAGISTIYAFLGVEVVSTGLLAKVADKLFGEGAINMAFSGRLSGAFGNSNIEASFYALGIILCTALLCETDKKLERMIWAFALACNAYAMVLGISLGAMTCFAVASVAYLIAARDKRGEILARLICGIACALIFGLLAAKLYSRSKTTMLLLLAVCVVAVVLWELLLNEKLAGIAQQKQKLIFGTVIGLAALAAGYIAIGLQISAPVTFTETTTWIECVVALTPGSHMLQLEADENTRIIIDSQDQMQLLAGQVNRLYDNRGKEANFTVPKGSVQCRVYLFGNSGETIYKATIDGKDEIVLSHRILPEIIAQRLANPLKTNGSVTQRLVYVQDGFRLFKRSPIAGLGSGAFESSVSQVQDYEYETVHSHNQYIETLLEGGVIGFVLFFGTLAALGIALWKSRKKAREGELGWIYPALCAEFVMSALQMFWDVSMSVTVFACMIYTLYGIIVSTCAEPLALEKSEAEQGASVSKKNKAATKPRSDTGLRVACSLLPLLFVMSVGLNVHAQHVIREPVESLAQFMGNLERAAKMDLYERNDIKLSYVRAQMENDEERKYYAQANEYARQLSSVQSNSIPYILVVYYLNTQQYELAIEEAKAGARYSPSDSEVWNNIIDALKQMFIDSGANSPLLYDADGTLLRGLMEYYGKLQERDARSLKPIALNKNSKEFFEKLQALNDCNGNKEAMYEVLVPAVEG